MDNLLSLLKFKKQIILQGPPGTGKTKLAKELAIEIIGTNNLDINENDIINTLKDLNKISTVAGNVEYEVVKVDEVAKTVTLKKSTETEATTTFAKVIDFYKNKEWKTPAANNDDRRAAAIAKYIFENKKTSHQDVNEDQVKIIQFHPSYTYEDFVRGIVAESNGEKIEYKNVNKTLGLFAELAKKNWDDSKKDIVNISKEKKLREYFDLFADKIGEQLADGTTTLKLTNNVNLVDVEDDAFRYKGNEGWSLWGNRMLFKDIIQAF
ncbi:MAG: AAA family ATPase [Chitinophagaceae bacterium]|nr:AAA family ATPase [Chitinophagaceae bacterium]